MLLVAAERERRVRYLRGEPAGGILGVAGLEEGKVGNAAGRSRFGVAVDIERERRQLGDAQVKQGGAGTADAVDVAPRRQDGAAQLGAEGVAREYVGQLSG